MSKVTTAKLTVQDIAERRGVHEQTAQMMFDTHIIEGKCLNEGWTCIEKALTAYLKEHRPVSREDMLEAWYRMTSGCRTMLQQLWELDMLTAERECPPGHEQASSYFKGQVHELIDAMTSVIAKGNQALEETQKRQPS